VTTTYVGTVSVGVVCPVAVTLGAQLALRLGELNELYAEVTAKIGNITANLTLIADVTLPSIPSLTLGLQGAIAGLATLVAQFPLASVNIGASLQADIDALLMLQAAIQVKLDAILALQADLTLALAGAGIAVYAYEGRADHVGSELAAELSSGLPGGGGAAQAVHALVLACASPADWERLGMVVATG
jgi:hypothetical protein